MSASGLSLVVLAAFCTVVANLSLRAGILRVGSFSLSVSTLGSQLFALARQPAFLFGFILYGLAALVWFRIVSTEHLSTSYPVLVSLTFVFVTVGSMLFFHEGISWQKVLGLAVILTGIVLVARA